ncbi:transferrin-binding protein-like solute binding protein [Sphingomonas yunnanensis]|uniref:transferrin-binding protein-like solute binding protein n=1 Tax=Sphingomonas yunnanensis TaxID=310400 RepID=UPI001CA78D81|nr:transferrin-binding protein-like solute binding protein [Sphingomonas yunnanensis]MBY9064267.1 transferrin-binding protein-like solute binding protein [Sphingomonas yunnanensis]
MRSLIVALALPLAACGGAGDGLSSAGSSAATGGASGTTGIALPPPAGSTATQANMFDVTAATKFDAVSAMHSLSVSATKSELYQGNASTADSPAGSISYDPRDGIFVMTLADAKADITRNITFQDPGHRTTADSGRVEPQVPLLAGFNYLSVLDGETPLTFFYQRPNSVGSFVSLAGFERNEKRADGSSTSEQGVLVFGTRTPLFQTPTKGTARFDGQFLATIMAQRDDFSERAQQWLAGSSAVDVDFASRKVALTLSGTVGQTFIQNGPVANTALSVPAGSTFNATGTASWGTFSNAFSGKFAAASFTTDGKVTPVDFTSVSAGTSTAGASSIDGAFYGPDAKNVGGNFRIVGGIPNQRVDILGGFTGTKK